MSTIEGVIGNSSGSLQSLASASLGKEDFFQMLIAQLQNQDPLNPLDGTDFTAQLAQFSSLEQLFNVNEQLELMGLYQSSLNSAQAVGLIAKEITASGDSVIVDGSSADITYSLAQEAGKVTVKIYDEEGVLVDTLDPGIEGQKAGGNTITWDCSGVGSGTYTFEVSAFSVSGDAIETDTVMTGKVTGVTFVDGTPFLSVGGQTVSFGDVLSVKEPET
jgi:flagellar basal-body rod modification protein FlgD